MESKGISIYQFIFFGFLLNTCTIQAAYPNFVNDPSQRKLCRVKKSESVCEADNKCTWHDGQWMCNEAGYQPDIQHCNEIIPAICSGHSFV